jgi:AmmeMemoRadiSam system protein A
MLDQHEREELLRRARAAIAASLGIPSPEGEGVPSALARHAGAFVTLRDRNQLRGCIGYLETDLRLADVVQRCAVSAARSDPRFPPLSRAEFATMEIEISVLGSLQPVSDVRDIHVGRDGLLVQLGGRRGLLLPQVATEWGWDRETFLAHACLKAGLSPDAWQTGAQLLKFEAEVFKEDRGAQDHSPPSGREGSAGS